MVVAEHHSERSEVVEQASKYLVKLLRHGTEDTEISVDSRGWCNLKDVRLVFSEQFQENTLDLLNDVLDADDENRLEVQSSEDVSFIRATRKHTRENVDLIDPLPDEDDLTWFLYQHECEDRIESAYVSATSAEVASKLLNRRSDIPHLSGRTTSPEEFAETNKETISESILKRGLGNPNPSVKVHQSADEHLSVDARSNMGGYKGLYVKNHPQRTRNRICTDLEDVFSNTM